ncbi:hypothetical protein [Rhizobacter sp. Root1221]|uniref:hypothetical protein n=1 Tax=Rhizobacter sp. Root1221 TaxID=1736433 RepID=UPI0006F43076|nr:hypothetical protein [Rhizobacter sp. Root1221]KQW02208.1 hypothetical protein ASC87_13335 [Rhizobacter sp. Root1221]
MTFGLQGFTEGGALLYSTEGKSLHFLGVAAYSSSPSTLMARYAIQSATYPVVLARMAVGDTLCIQNVSNGGGNTWYIDVLGPQRMGAVLLCYGALTNEPSLGSFGLRALTSSGEVSFDSTRNPLWLSEVHTQYGESLAVANMSAAYARSYMSPACSVYAAAQHAPGPGAAGGIFMLGIKRVAGGHTYAWTTAYAGTTGGSPSSTAFRVNNAVFVIESSGLT